MSTPELQTLAEKLALLKDPNGLLDRALRAEQAEAEREVLRAEIRRKRLEAPALAAEAARRAEEERIAKERLRVEQQERADDWARRVARVASALVELVHATNALKPSPDTAEDLCAYAGRVTSSILTSNANTWNVRRYLNLTVLSDNGYASTATGAWTIERIERVKELNRIAAAAQGDASKDDPQALASSLSSQGFAVPDAQDPSDAELDALAATAAAATDGAS